MVLLLVPASAQAVAPTCNDMNVGVPHNAATPIFIDCSGGSGAGSPDVLIASSPSKGTLSPSNGQTSADQWVTYTPSPGQSGTDSFTFRGVSPGSGGGGSDELSASRTVNIRIAAGSPPVCANLSQSVPQETATNLRLTCASGGDPITAYSITDPPDHGILEHDEPERRPRDVHVLARLRRSGLLPVQRDEHLRCGELPIAIRDLRPPGARPAAGS